MFHLLIFTEGIDFRWEGGIARPAISTHPQDLHKFFIPPLWKLKNTPEGNQLFWKLQENCLESINCGVFS